MASIGFEMSEIGKVNGYLMEGFVRPSVSLNSRTVYLSSGVHGDEPAGPLAIEKMAKENQFFEDINWIVCPMLNPTGHVAGKRENSKGIDLNRDYFHKESEEVVAHTSWLQKQVVPDLMLSLHEDWEASGYYFYEIDINGSSNGRAQELMKFLDKEMNREPSVLIDDHKVRERGWIYHEAIADEFEAWPEAIYFSNWGCPVSLTMETPSSLDLNTRVKLQVEFVRRAAVCELWE